MNSDFATSADLPEHAKGDPHKVAAWLFLWDGKPKALIATLLGIGDSTLYRWIDKWREEFNEPGLFRTEDPVRTAAMHEVRQERKLELVAERDRFAFEVIDTARMLNMHLQSAIRGDDFDHIEVLRQARDAAKQLDDGITADRLGRQIKKAVRMGGAKQLQSLAISFGIVTDKVIKMTSDASPEKPNDGLGWTLADETEFKEVVSEHKGNTHEDQEPRD